MEQKVMILVGCEYFGSYCGCMFFADNYCMAGFWRLY